MSQNTSKIVGETACSSSPFSVDDVIRIRDGRKYRVWKVTAVAIGGIGTENIIAIAPLDIHPGSIYGQTLKEYLVPQVLLAGVERVVSANGESQ